MMRILLLLLSLGLVVSLSACDEKPRKKTRVVRPRVVAKRPVKTVKKVPESNRPKFAYVAGERRDPFTSLLAVRKPLKSDLELETPLQKFGLKELKLTAIIIGKGEPRAMVIAPDNKAYILSAGIKIGRNRGVINEITKDEVIVEESFRDFSGGVRTEIKSITLPNREGE
ncbi:MAG: hypothetical protein B6I36_08655 [Desulfobacteraceae bacterium 4572_35.1]|nr:MAG: hypothetical protein B6I36_08655 [Desulfobacteraceae bacterium 4572_35.1]